MKRTPKHVIIEVEGTKEYFLTSIYVARVFSKDIGGNSPDDLGEAFSKQPLESIMRLSEISYNNYPGNDQLNEMEFSTLVDVMATEEMEVPYEKVEFDTGEKDEEGNPIMDVSYEKGKSTITKWQYLQDELLRNCFPKPKRVKNPNGVASPKESVTP